MEGQVRKKNDLNDNINLMREENEGIGDG